MIERNAADRGAGEGAAELFLVVGDPAAAAELALEGGEALPAGAERLVVDQVAGTLATAGRARPIATGRNDRCHPPGAGRVQSFHLVAAHRQPADTSGAWALGLARSKR